MEEAAYCVYVHISPENKRYFGITKQEPSRRWARGLGYRGNEHFTRAIQKYGWDNFLHCVLESGLTKRDAEELEIELIKEYKSNDPNNGYNIENGGNCCGTHSEETRRKIGATSKGNKRCAGRKMSEWHKQRMIDGARHWRETAVKTKRKYPGLRGELSPWYGRRHTEETRKVISEKHKELWKNEEYRNKMMRIVQRRDLSGENNPMYGRKHSRETLKKMSDGIKKAAHSEKNLSRLKTLHEKIKIPVVQFSIDMVEIARFDSATSAAPTVNGNPQNIGKSCRNKSRAYKGFYWRYASESDC